MTTEKQETIRVDFIEAIRNVVANAIIQKRNGDYVFSSEKIVGQIEMTVDHFLPLATQSAVQKARTEVAGEIIEDIKNYIYKSEKQPTIEYLQAKYLSPNQEKDTLLCGCPRLDRFSMCIKQEHCACDSVSQYRADLLRARGMK